MVFFSATSPDQVTDLPAFNEFQVAVQSSLEGHSTEEELGKSYLQLDVVLGQVLFYFSEQVHFQPATPELEEQTQQVYRRIDGVRDESELACKACLVQDEEAARLHLDAARLELVALTTLFAALKIEEEARPKFSPLPWVHDLCRVAVACRQGQLTVDHLAERLETSQQLHQRAATAIPMVPPLITDRQRWRELVASMEASLAEIGEGMQSVDAFLETGNPDTLDQGLEQCMGGAVKLMEDYETVKRLEAEQPGLQCPLCSEENLVGALRCQHCSAQLPRLADMEEAIQQSEISWPSHVQSLVQSLEGLQGGSRESGPVLTEVAQMRERFERGLQDFENMKVPEEGLSDEELDLIDETRERVLLDSQKALGALEQMTQAIKDGQWDFLQTVTQQFLLQVESLLEALPNQ